MRRLIPKSRFLIPVFLAAVLVLQFAPLVAQAVVYNPSQIVFTVTTAQTIYRSYVGGPDIVITAQTGIPPGAPQITTNDEINYTVNANITGFYLATVGAGTTNICSTLGCSYTAKSPDPVSSVATTTFSITVKADILAALGGLNGNHYDKDMWVFEVVGTTWVDAPITNNIPTVRTEVYVDQAAYNAAAAAAGLTPQQFAAGGRGNPTTGGGSGGPSVAGWFADKVTGGVLSLVNSILAVIIMILRWIVYLIGVYIVLPLLETTLTMDAANIAGTIQFGWSFVRDIVNMIFILILIVLGFATILRMESYNYRHILVELIIMAVLVNFSLVIARIIVQVADLVQFTFLPQAEGQSGIRYLFLQLSQQSTFALTNFSASTSGALASTVKLIFQFVLELGLVITFGALAVFTLIRIIALWILMILSPFAYALHVLPATKSKAEEWWHTFIKYAFFTPVIAFFIRLTFELYRNGLQFIATSSFASGKATLTMPQYVSSISSATPSLADTLTLLVTYMVVLGFMWAGIIVSQKIGIIGADAVTDIAKKGMAAPFAGGKRILVGEHPSKELGGLAGLAARTYSGLMGRKAFSETDKEAMAMFQQAEKQKQLQIAQSRLARLRAKQASGQPLTAQEQAQMVKDQRAVSVLPSQITKAEHEEHRAARRKKLFSLAQFLNPDALRHGWNERSEMIKKRAYTPATGAVHDMLNKYLPTEWGIFHKRGRTLGRDTEHGFMGKFQVLKEEAKHLEGLRINREYASYIKHNIDKTGQVEDLYGANLLVMQQKNQDDFHNMLEVSPGADAFSYSPDIDLEYNTKGPWKRMTAEEKRILVSQMQESEEERGITRNIGFYNEGTRRLANDLSYLSDQEIFNGEKQRIIEIIDRTDPNQQDAGLQRFKVQLQQVTSGGQIAPGSELARNIAQVNMADVVVSKKRRGKAVKWLPSMEPATVRLQGPNGWTEYTTKGKLELHNMSPTHLQSWIGRIHEGETRALVFGGAMVDPDTGETRLPTANDDPVMKEAWNTVVRIKPEIAAAVHAYFAGIDPVVAKNDAIKTPQLYQAPQTPQVPNSKGLLLP